MAFKAPVPPKTIGDFLDKVISETITLPRTSLHKATERERALQQKTVANISSEKKGNPRPVKEDEEVQTQSPAPSPESSEPSENKKDDQQMRAGDIEVSDVIEKLNAIRAGRSFRDENIYSELEKYFNGLDDAERVALFAYLKGIQEIVSGVGEAEDAVEPSDPEPAVEMKRDPSKHSVHIKPNVIKKGGSSGDMAQKKPQEDTSGPVPIKPKTVK